MNKEQKFYNILQDLFVGAKLEGDSGYVNLMNIKTVYFDLIKKKIEAEIKQKFGENKPEDLYDKLYTFFDSYFSDGGAIFFSSTPSYKNIYAKVYSDREDVSLFWKTAKLYYVKSEANYRTIENLQLNSDPEITFDFHFDASLLKHKQANEKKELKFYFVGLKTRAGKKVVKFRVIYKNDNKYDKLKDILDIKDNAKIIKFILENSEKLNKKILFKNDGLDLKILNEKGGKDFVKTELLVQQNEDLFDGVSVEPVISDAEDIEKYLRLKSIILSSENIEKAFKVYKKQTEIDYFIHKDAKRFLREQFDLYMYQHLAGSMDTIFEQEELDRIRKTKEIAYLAIEYVGNFEDELKKIWLKPKFARKSNYVVTLDRLADKTNGIKVLESILKHKGMIEQIAEWQDLGVVKTDFDIKEIIKAKKLNKDCEKLPVDTRYFKDLEVEIIGLFDNLDEALDGRLIKSDNFQALNTLLPKYREQIQTIYIDPPFNLDDNGDFDYLVNYKDSTWASLLENRLQLAREYLKKEGNIFVRCDSNGNHIVRCLLDSLFNKNFQNEIVLNRFKKKSGVLTNTTESLFLYSASEVIKFNKILKERECTYCKQVIETKWGWAHSAGESKIPKYFKVDGKNVLLYPPKGRHWTNSQDVIYELEEKGRMRINKDTSYTDINGLKIRFIPEKLQAPDTEIDNNWTDIPGYEFGVFSKEKFSTQNSEELLERVVRSGSDNLNIVFDFFAGSGTTLSLAQKLNRKWLGVEMGSHCYEKVLPRMKRVAAFLKTEQLESVPEYQGGSFFKYYELEQYEDALKKSVYNPTEKELENIDFSLSEKQAKVALDIDLKKETARFVFEKLYPDVDIPETISNLFGKKIKKITKDKVVFEDESEVDLNNLDFEKYEPLKKLIYW